MVIESGNTVEATEGMKWYNDQGQGYNQVLGIDQVQGVPNRLSWHNPERGNDGSRRVEREQRRGEREVGCFQYNSTDKEPYGADQRSLRTCKKTQRLGNREEPPVDSGREQGGSSYGGLASQHQTLGASTEVIIETQPYPMGHNGMCIKTF